MRVVAAAARAVRLYAFVLGAAAVLIFAATIDDGRPDRTEDWIPNLFVGALAAVPPVLLFVFSTALAALAGLPERLRSTPGELRGHTGEAQRLVGEIAAWRALGFVGVVLLPFRLLRLGGGARETLTPYAPVLPLVSPPFLTAAGLAALAGLGELLIGVVALVDLAD